jgi:hypothetical protein
MTTWTRRGSLALLAAACLALPASAAYGRATHEPILAQDSFSDTTTDFPCFEGLPVTMTGTDTVVGRFVTDGEHHRGYHFTETIEYRVDIGDGRYAEGGVVNHFTVSNNMVRPLTTVKSTQVERATIYTPDGLPAGEIVLHIASHKTYSDTNGDRFPDPDEIIVAVENVKLTCP